MNAIDYFTTRDELLSVLTESLKNQQIERFSPMIRSRIDYICSKISSDSVFYTRTIEKAQKILDRIKSDLKNIEESSNNSIYLRDILSAIGDLFRTCRTEDPGRFADYNSENFYTKQIQELQEKERLLNIELSALKQKSAEHAKKEKELDNIKEQIKNSIAEKDELRKKLDARENMKERISTAFIELKKHISPLKKEEKRLNWMFYAYAALCVFVLGIFVYFELSYLSKWEGAKNWIDYLPYYVPVPIVGGLLWVFIYQMNRVQRQLIQVANVLYHIDYIEGLLLAINLVSADVNSASEKISHVLDNLIKNYMSTPDSLSEQSLDAEISKDNINIHTFINLAKEIKDVIKQ